MVLKTIFDKGRINFKCSWSYHQEKFIWDIRIIAITPGGENNQPCRTYSFRDPQIKMDDCWKPSTA